VLDPPRVEARDHGRGEGGLPKKTRMPREELTRQIDDRPPSVKRLPAACPGFGVGKLAKFHPHDG